MHRVPWIINLWMIYELEIEELILYPSIEKRLRSYGTAFHTVHKPDNIPPEWI